jgi:cytochrome c biogenesis protein CcmG/thiol:disulfide interchange protein DsbE
VDETLRRRRQEWAEARRRKERRGGRIILAVLAVLTAGTAYSAVQRLRAAGTDVASLGIADYRAEATGERRPAPEFVYPGLRQGETISSSAFEGEVLVVNFWASWCGPCRVEAPALERIRQRYRDAGVEFLGVDFKDDRYAAQAFEDEFGLSYRSAFDPSGSLAHEFGVLAMPSTFVISADGWIEYQFTGIVTESLLRDALEDVLRGGG